MAENIDKYLKKVPEPALEEGEAKNFGEHAEIVVDTFHGKRLQRGAEDMQTVMKMCGARKALRKTQEKMEEAEKALLAEEARKALYASSGCHMMQKGKESNASGSQDFQAELQLALRLTLNMEAEKVQQLCMEEGQDLPVELQRGMEAMGMEVNKEEESGGPGGARATGAAVGDKWTNYGVKGEGYVAPVLYEPPGEWHYSEDERKPGDSMADLPQCVEQEKKKKKKKKKTVSQVKKKRCHD